MTETTKLSQDTLLAIVYGYHGAPGQVLGKHTLHDGKTVIRSLRPTAQNLYLVDESNNSRHTMQRIHEHGLFEIVLNAPADAIQYHYLLETHEGQEQVTRDPYIYPAWFTDYELYLFGEGRYQNSYDKFGAHTREVDGVIGINFAVWAPNALRVSVVGDFNNWDGRVHPMQQHEANGVWELFIPGLEVGIHYKYEIKSKYNDYLAEKADPYAFHTEHRPKTASIAHDIDVYSWNDADWMQARQQENILEQPMLIYELHPGSWKRKSNNAWLSYRELAHELVDYLKDMNFTHVELMPVAEHPLDASWGYQVTGYYAPSSRYGTPEDFMYFVDYCHQNGIGVILDWVPAHFPKDGHALSYFDGTHLYEHEDTRQREHPDWGTRIFNYGRNEVRNFLISNAIFWLEKYHIDGLRVDAVSSMIYLDFGRKDGEWVPNQYGGNENLEAISFMQEANTVIHEKFPGAVTIAEESTAWAMVSRPTYVGGLGFTLKWNMGWMHDTLKYMQKDPIHRRYHHHQLTFSMMYAFSENFVLSLSHDEVVHGKGSIIGKMAGDWWQKFASVRLLTGYQLTHPGKKLMFMGQEIGQWREWSEERSLDWHLLELPTHQGLQAWVRDLGKLYREQPALYQVDFTPDGFQWVDANDADHSIYTFIRFAKDPLDFIVIAANFTPVPRENYRIGVPEWGYYQELLNSDAEVYGGGNVGNDGGRTTEAIPWNGHNQSINVTVPPLGILILKLAR